MTQVVSPSASTRLIAEALNTLAGRIAVGTVTLGSGVSTTITNPAIGSNSVVLLSPRPGAVASTVTVTPGAGVATLTHGDQQGQVFGYVVVT